MSIKGIIVFLGMNNTRLERKILIILDFENGFLPTYLPQCNAHFSAGFKIVSLTVEFVLKRVLEIPTHSFVFITDNRSACAKNVHKSVNLRLKMCSLDQWTFIVT